MEAFSILGGVEYLCRVARDDPKAFCALLAKIIPVKVAGDEDNPMALRVTIDAPARRNQRAVACPNSARAWTTRPGTAKGKAIASPPQVAVGTRISPRPPRRSRRAAFPHRALVLGRM